MIESSLAIGLHFGHPNFNFLHGVESTKKKKKKKKLIPKRKRKEKVTLVYDTSVNVSP